MAAPFQTNPCGLSYVRTLQIIKDNVLNAGYNGRDEVMKALLKEGFTYTESRQVADQYFSIYKRVSSDFKNKKPSIILSHQEQSKKRLNNIAVDFLNGDLKTFPMNSDDIKALEKIYEKANIAQTATLKEKYNEQAAVFVQKFLPDYANELFKTSVYARPLLSAVFFIKSLTSNLHGQIERSITDTLWDGRRMDFTRLSKVGDLANASALNVLNGGVPATSLYQSEANVGTAKGRLEEFSIKGTDAASSGLKASYYNAMKFMSKWSNRFNSAPDTRGIFSNAERHFYQLLKEKYRNEGKTQSEAVQLALKDIELDDKDTAIKIATAKFKELGLDINGKNGKPTSEFNVAVAEYQRIKRDDVIWGKALQLSKNDFWKRNMTVASELGFGDYGLFGLKAQMLAGVRAKLETGSKSKVTSAFNLYAFGFLNGAANFAEDAIERIPLYGAVKIGFLQAKKGKVTDQALQSDISRRQRDIIAKNLITVTFFAAARMAEHLICPDQEKKVSSKDISAGRTQIGVCGIPAVVPPQLMVAYKFYKIIENAVTNDEEFFNTVQNILPVLTQTNELGLGGDADKVAQGAAKWTVAKASGNQIKADEEAAKLGKSVVASASSYANSFLPLPSRLMNEGATIAQRIEGKTQKQQALPFFTDEMNKPLGWAQSLGKVSIASLGNVTGISEIMIAASGSQKTYAVDWQGRTVAQFRGSDITGSGIQYTAADDILATAGVKTPYVNRLEKIEVDSKKEKQKGFLKESVLVKKEVRYLSDEEYFEVSVALGNFNKEYFDKNEKILIKSVKEDKILASKQINTVFDATKEKALEAIEKGKKTDKDILTYIKANWQSKRKGRRTETSF